MPIRWDTRNKRWRYEFDRYVEGQRKRASKLLPKGWTQAQADAFDRKEGGRLWAVATGVEQTDPLIETAVLHYLRDKTHLKSFDSVEENLSQIAWAYLGKTFADLAEVAKLINDTREGVREGVVLKDATVKNRLSLLKAACRWGWKQHAMSISDPTVRMQMPEVKNERHIYASRLQMIHLARAADRADVRALIRTAFYTGMRLGELMRVEVGDGVLHLADTKNGDRRSVPIHPKIQTCLRFLPLAAKKRTLQAAWNRARKAVGLRRVNLHDLRHSAASEMINADVDLFTVGAVLGHKDPRSTKRYSHLTYNTLAAAVGKIGRKSPHKPQEKDRPKAA